MKGRESLLHKGEGLHNGFIQLKNLNALNSILTIDTQYIFFNVLYDVFFFSSYCSTWNCLLLYM